MDSFEILPKNIPKKIIHIKIRTNEAKKLVNPASATKKNGKMATKMFSMGANGWDIEDGWYESPKAAKAALEPKVTMKSFEVNIQEPDKKIDLRTKEGRAMKAQLDDDSTGSDQ